jgi:CheY-like chemotaxis protein
VADDDAHDALLLKLTAEKLNLEIPLRTVCDGVEAIDYLLGRNAYTDRQAHPFPSILLLDLKMPKMSGFDVLNFVRTQPGVRQLPVIIFSSSDDPGDIRRAYEGGANSYLCKPVSNEGLTELLTALRCYWYQFNHFPPCR